MIRSLRLRLLLSTSLASSITLTLLGFSIYAFMWHRLLVEFDVALLAKARTVAAMVESADNLISFDADLGQLPEFSSIRHPEYFEIWLTSGKVLARSPSLGKKNLVQSEADSDPSSIATLLPDGHRGRAITLKFPIHFENEADLPTTAQPHPDAIIVLAGRPIEMNHGLDDLGWLLFMACAIAVVVSGVALIHIVGQAIKPVNQLASEIGSLRETDLSRRLGLAKVPRELDPIVEKLNGLFARLDESFNREKAFTADVAHELRTPLAGIQTTLEVCRSRPRESAEYESAIDDCRAMIGRLHLMIETLLMLARADAGQLPNRKQQIDVQQLMQECWLPLREQIEKKRVSIQSDCSGNSVVEIDADKLRMILQNLLENAASYVNGGGSIRCSISRLDQQIQIVISNTGSQISPVDVGHLFDRFWRGDASRTETGIHCGLGLSLCKRLISVLNGHIAIHTNIGADFSVTMRLPVA